MSTRLDSAEARPVSRAERVEADDLARGFALLGMMLVHLAACWIDSVWQRSIGKGPLGWLMRGLSVAGRRTRA